MVDKDINVAVFRKGDRRVFMIDVPDEHLEEFLKQLGVSKPRYGFVKPKGRTND